MVTITNEIVESVQKFLIRHKAMEFFLRVKQEKGKLSCVLTHNEVEAFYTGKICRDKGSSIPHPIHLREGMIIRNHLRKSKLCDNWTAADLDNRWTEIVERAIAQEEESENRRKGRTF